MLIAGGVSFVVDAFRPKFPACTLLERGGNSTGIAMTKKQCNMMYHTIWYCAFNTFDNMIGQYVGGTACMYSMCNVIILIMHCPLNCAGEEHGAYVIYASYRIALFYVCKERHM